MHNNHHDGFVCSVCHEKKSVHEAKPLELINHPIDDLIRAEVPGIGAQDTICFGCRSRFRTGYIESVLRAERGEISELEEDVLESLKEHQLVSKNINPEFDRQLTFGERIADKVAEFGGSWRFIILFGMVLGRSSTASASASAVPV